MNTKSQLVVECYQLAFFVKIALEKIRKISSGKKKKHDLHHNIWQKKTKSKNHVLKSNNKVLAFNIKLNLQQKLRF